MRRETQVRPTPVTPSATLATLVPRCIAALVCAVLCAPPATAHSPAPAPDLAADAPAPDPAAGAPGAIAAGATEAMSAEVDRLFARAAAAGERHERARRAAAGKHVQAAYLHHEAAAERHWLNTLHHSIGREARAQYRGGGRGLGPVVRLLMAQDPSRFLAGADRMRRARSVVRNLHAEVRASETRLRRQETRADEVARARQRDVRVQATARREVEQTLETARERLRVLKETSRSKPRSTWLPKNNCAYKPYKPPKPPRSAKPDDAKPHYARPFHAKPSQAKPPHAKSPQPKQSQNSTWTAPVTGGGLSASFGAGGKHWKKRHTGQDFAVRTGSTVRAVGAGKVIAAGCGDGFGNQIVIKHPNGYYTQYAHLSVLNVRHGDKVSTGQRIGLSGATGNVSGPHLHFEVRLTPYMGSGIDPMPWLRDHGVRM